MTRFHKPARPSRLLLTLLTLPALAFGKDAPLPARQEFDTGILQQRGLDPALAEYFRDAPRFQQGEHAVSLAVNGQRRGRVLARFDNAGALCVSPALIAAARLRPADKATAAPDQAQPAANSAAGEAGCTSFANAYPAIQITLRPNREALDLTIPYDLQAPQNQSVDLSSYASGGTAALLNYNLLTQRSEFGGRSRDYLSAQIDAGVNVADWIVRSRQSFTSTEQGSKLQHLYTYAQHTLRDASAILQVGQIDVSNALFAGVPLSGVQLMPETALQQKAGGGARVEGIARTQARVEVRQNNVLVYSTVVSPGSFSLENVPLLSARLDAQVTVIESDGVARDFTIPAAALNIGQQGATPGYSLALGKIRTQGAEEQRQPYVVTGSGSWPLARVGTLTAGALSAGGYGALGASVDAAIGKQATVSAQTTFAHSDPASGVQTTLSASARLMPSLSTSWSASQRSYGYRDLMQVLAPTSQASIDAQYKTQYTGSLNWQSASLGALGASYTSSSQFMGRTTERAFLTWNRKFGPASVSLNLERNLGSRQLARDDGTSYYLNLSLPLDGKRTLSASSSQSQARQRHAVAYSESVSDTLNYQVSANHDAQGRQSGVAASVGMLPRYLRANLSYAHAIGGYTNYAGAFQGGVAAHAQGITFSPHPLGDTFGIVTLGDLSGVRINTPAGPTWTDAWGNAVVPRLTPFGKSNITVATKTLPKRIDVANGAREVHAGRGSVSRIAFDVVDVRRFLLNVRSDAFALPKGASVVDANDQFITTVLDDQTVFLGSGQDHSDLRVSLPTGESCRLEFDVPKSADADTYYENLEATCRKT